MSANKNGKNFSSFLPEDNRSKNLLSEAMVFCLQFQFLVLELCGQPVPLMAGNKNDLSWGTESCSTQAATKPRVADERMLIKD